MDLAYIDTETDIVQLHLDLEGQKSPLFKNFKTISLGNTNDKNFQDLTNRLTGNSNTMKPDKSHIRASSVDADVNDLMRSRKEKKSKPFLEYGAGI